MRGAPAMLLLLACGGCTMLDNALASIPIFTFMHSAPSFDPYEAPRPAPAHSVPFESPTEDLLPEITPTDAGLNEFAAGPFGRSPYRLAELTAIGQNAYLRHCMVCHGPGGQGDGPILSKPGGPPKYPFAPNLTLPASVERPDGYIYGIIRSGRGLMPAYGSRTTHRERWAIVAYVRTLQGRAPGADSAAAAVAR
jgi:mono/diheme cytochrome c family protein